MLPEHEERRLATMWGNPEKSSTALPDGNHGGAESRVWAALYQ
jgi:hypothetical protein